MLAGDLLVAFALDFVLGDAEWFPHPVRAIGYLIRRTEALLRGQPLKYHSREKSSALSEGGYSFVQKRRDSGTVAAVVDRGGDFLAGVLAVLLVVVLSGFFVWGSLRIAACFGFWVERTVSVIWLYFGLSARCLAREAGRVQHKLSTGDLPAARTELARIVGRDTGSLDEAGVSRAAIESVAENTVDGIISPVFYAVLGGPVLMWVFKAVSTCDSMIGYRNSRYERFGTFGARLDDVANYLPARLSFVLFPLAAAMTRLSWIRAWQIARRDRRHHRSLNSGIPEAAMAGALGVQLGGPAVYEGRQVSREPFGAEFPPAGFGYIAKAVEMMWAVALLALLAAMLVLQLIQT